MQPTPSASSNCLALLKTILLSVILFGVAHPSTASAASLSFTGGDWLDPANWLTDTGAPAGAVPTAADAVLIHNTTATATDAALHIGSLTLGGSLQLENTSLEIDGELGFVEPDASFIGNNSGAFRFNPSNLAFNNLISPTGSYADLFVWDFGLGGTTAASTGNTGSGHHAALHARGNAELFGILEVSFLYGFVPSPGDLFTVMTIDGNATGTFANAAEGALVSRFGGTDLYITYQGGNGNDVVLSAQLTPVPEPATLLLLATGLFGLVGYRWRRSSMSTHRIVASPLAILSAIFLGATLPSGASAASLSFAGGDWLDPTNWLTDIGAPAGVVPTAADAVLIHNATATATDAALHIGSLTLGGQLTLENTSLEIDGDLDFVQPDASFIGNSNGNFRFNPSSMAFNNLISPTGADFDLFAWDFGLGGTAAASTGNTGNGHHAALHARGDAGLFGILEVSFLYGFVPSPGDLFTVMTIDGNATGTFANAAEGALVSRFDGTDLYITYQGGDGNDVVLSAQLTPVPEPSTLLLLATGLLGMIGYRRRRTSIPAHRLSAIPPAMLIAGFFWVALPSTASAASLSFAGGDWLDPTNWLTDIGAPAGVVPTAADAVLIHNATATATDAALHIGSLTLGGQLTLENTSLEIDGDLDFVQPDASFAGGNAGTFRFNPSSMGFNNLISPTGSYADLFVWDFGLGGTTAASTGNTGNGHHAALHARGDAGLFGVLEVSFLYGFVPSPGDLFTVMTIDGNATGTFANATEGALVSRFGGTDLYITYQGGDGNDVVLSAQLTPVPEPATFLLLATGLAGMLAYRRRT